MQRPSYDYDYETETMTITRFESAFRVLTPDDHRRLAQLIDCAQLTLDLYTYLSPAQQAGLRQKITQFRSLLPRDYQVDQ